MLRDLWSQLRGGRMQMSGESPELKADPINPAWVTDGAPVARAAVLTESADGRMRSGIWECTAGRFDWHFAFDETVQILEGEVHVESNGRLIVLTPGSQAYFPFGLSTRWYVPKYVKKAFTHRVPGRLMRAARTVGSRIFQPVVAAAALSHDWVAVTATSL